MSKSDASVSAEGRAEAQRASVYDFLYHDVRRVASYLAQFDPSGHLTGLKQTETANEQESEEVGMQAAANAVLARANGNFLKRRGSSGGETSERMYDPLWTNARALLDYATEHSLLTRDLASARMGQFGVVSGQLMVMDLSMLKVAWDEPDIKRVVRAGVPQSVPTGNREQRRQNKQNFPSEVDLLFALLKLLPHSLQARLIGNDVSVWCSLDESYVVGRASDLMIKHGTLIGGEWTILGVVDAFPYDPDYVAADGKTVTSVLANLAATPVGQLAVQLAPVAQQLLGRPPMAYGMTPLLIFREIAG